MTDRNVRFLALDRDEAKQVFSKKEATGLAEVLDALWKQDPRIAAQRNLDLGLDSPGYVSLIEGCASLDSAGKTLLTRGGRPLPATAPTEVFLLRPDLIGPLSLAATSIDKLGNFLAGAAARGEAMVIVFFA